MTKESFLQQVQELSEEQFAKLSPFLEEDLKAVDSLDSLHDDIAKGRESAKNEPLLEAKDVYQRVRDTLA